MRRKFLVVVVALFVCFVSSSAQRVVESESNILFGQKSANVSLIVVNDGKAFDGKIALELIDPTDKVRGKTQLAVTFEPGRTTHLIAVTFDELSESDRDNLAWFRLRYTVGETRGIVSVSEINRDLFELRVIASDLALSGMTYRTRVRALNPLTQKPVGNVDVNVVLALGLRGDDEDDLKFKLDGKGETDSDGFAVVDFQIPIDKNLNGRGEIFVKGNKNGIYREAREGVQLPPDDYRFLMLVDKPIYQPEQTLNVRGILFKGSESQTVAAGAEVEFRVLDEGGTVLFRQTARTSAFGVAAIDWKIPENAKLGDYFVRVRVNDEDDSEDVGYQKIRVSRYDLPNFSVTAKSAKPFYLPSERIAEIEVNADYLFGKPVTKGKVRVARETDREWNWKEQKYDVEEGDSREGSTDKTGKFSARFDLGDDFDELDESDRFEDLNFTAYFTDLTTNRTEQRRFKVRITHEPIHVYYIGEKWDRSAKLPVTAYVSTFYADGSPAACDVEFKAREEDGDDEKYRTLQRLRTNSFGAGRLTYKRPNYDDEDADLEIQLIARDKNGLRGTYGVGEDKEEEVYFDEDDAISLTANKSIFKPGEAIDIVIESSLQTGTVFIDVARGLSVLDSRFVNLSKGRARISIPYKPEFFGKLALTAFTEVDEEIVQASRGIIFPSQTSLRVDAKFDRESYKPGADASVGFGVSDANGNAAESALGVVVFDKAIEERARTDSDFGGTFDSYRDFLGYGEGFGDVNIKDINDLDLTKSIDDELQLVAEVILHDERYRPNVFRSRSYYTAASSVYAPYFRGQFEPFEKMLRTHYEKRDFDHATDDVSFARILRENDIDFDSFRDPWGQKYHLIFEVNRVHDVLRIQTSGADKTFGTADDFTISSMSFPYFPKTARALDRAFSEYRKRTGGFIRDEKTLLAEMGINELPDRFGRPYKFKFSVSGVYFVTKIRSVGPDGVDCDCSYKDDFDIWTNSENYFLATELTIAAILGKAKPFPADENAFRAALLAGDVNLDAIRDGFDEKVYLVKKQSSRYTDRVVVEKYRKYGEDADSERTIITPVTQDILTFNLRSKGPDRRENTSDDFTLAAFQGVISERTKDEVLQKPAITKPISYRVASGSIGGTVTDPSGAVISGATVTVTNEATSVVRTTTTSVEGRFIVSALETGSYSVRVDAPGFMAAVRGSVPVSGGSVRVDFILELGTVSSVVEVSSEGGTLEVSSSRSAVSQSQVAQLPVTQSRAMGLLDLEPGITVVTKSGDNDDSVTNSQKSTPRLREYFPETLFWAPEVLTDKDGKASVKFKMADNITTWKLYTIASTKQGKIGVAEKEMTVFQPFFVDLDPPKFLTDGDEIFLPTQVRNYTATKQKVGVTMSRADWFSLLGSETQNIEVASNRAGNAVFGFRATSAIKDGKQRVTALAEKESDAIEKPVTVRPNGHEVVRTESKLFSNKETFALDFPANALPKTARAELKIYPNLMSHVTESVEGLLQRPYGCGEQTISSTYPNLMILKFGAGSAALKRNAEKFLKKGHEKLLGYQVADGGFSYWGGKDSSDLALTAYALRFLTDANEFVETDPKITAGALAYLTKQQRADGSFTRKYGWEQNEDQRRTKLLTTYVARALAMVKAKSKEPVSAEFDATLAKTLAYLKARSEEIDEPYSIALYGLAAFDAGDREAATQTAARLAKLALTEGQNVYWNLETNTPFYGWGTPGRIETTALALQLLLKANEQRSTNNELITKATMFLLRNKDRYGVWYSTQTTINVLDAFLASLKPARDQKVLITAAGEMVKEIAVPADQIEPVVLDLNGQTASAIEIAGAADAPLMAQVVRTHYVDWKDAEITRRDVNQSRAVELDYKCDKQAAKIMETVTCSVKAERVGFTGYGMLLAEIGIPPGAEVSRESLEKAFENSWSLSRYEVLPDRIIIYLWAQSGGTKLDFTFKPRYGINAQTPASVLYDYYNEEAKATVAPMRFEVR